MLVKTIEPIAPEKVLLGLILVNFGPPNIFPKINPPMSEAIHPKRVIKSKIFEPNDADKKKLNKI